MPLIVFDLDGTLIDSQRDLADAANALIVERGGAPLAVDAIAGMVGEGAALLVGRARLYAGVRETLGALHPRVPLAILTNKPQHATDRILEGLDVARFFRWVLGGDTPSGRKPEPDGLRHLMSEASATAADTIMVGDSAIDLKTARAAGTRICLVRYGFGFRGVDGLLTGDEMLIDRPERLVDLV